MNITILDSGVGGRSILEKVKKTVPQHHYTYFADHNHFPYSTKSAEELKKIAVENIHHLIAGSTDVVIIACNSLTVAALDHLRQTFPATPFIGTVPSVKKAANTLPATAKVVILATEHTANSQYLKNLIEKFGRGQHFIPIGTTELVTAIENKNFMKAQKILQKLFMPYNHDQIAAVIIGCTHFSFVEKEIRNCFAYPIQIFDSIEGITKQLLKLTKN